MSATADNTTPANTSNNMTTHTNILVAGASAAASALDKNKGLATDKAISPLR